MALIVVSTGARPADARDGLPKVTVTCSGSHNVRCKATVTQIPEGWVSFDRPPRPNGEVRADDIDTEMYWAITLGAENQREQRDLLNFEVDVLMSPDDIFGEGGDPLVVGFEVEWTGICICGRSLTKYEGFFQVKFAGAPDPIKVRSGRSRQITCRRAP